MEISMTKAFDKERQEAIFGHPKCRELFEDKVEKIRVEASPSTDTLVKCFSKVLPELTDHQLNLTDEKYENMVNLIKGDRPVSDCHSGIFMLMVSHLKQISGKYYAETIDERLYCRLAVTSVENIIMEQVKELRTICIEEFYAAADSKTLDEIAKMETQLKSSQMGPQTINNGTN